MPGYAGRLCFEALQPASMLGVALNDSIVQTSPAPSAIPRIGANARGRDFAVGDIHGAFSALQRALDFIAFDPAADRLFSIGDLVDRGPESHEVLCWLDKPWFHAICGNHDFMAWRRALGDPFPDVDHRRHGGGWLDELSATEQQRIGQRLAALPIALEVETQAGLIGLVHADCPSDDWLDMHEMDMGRIAQVNSPAGQCLWSTARYEYRYNGVVKNVRAVVHGHLTIPSMVTLGNAYFIDTGGWRTTGHFTFLGLQALTPTLGPCGRASVMPSRRNR